MRTRLGPNEWVVTDLREGEFVIVHSETFGEVDGYVHHLVVPEPPAACYRLPKRKPTVFVRVGLALDRNHPAVQDTLADNPEVAGYAIELEFVDIVPFSAIERTDLASRAPRFWTESIMDRERAERARRRGFERLALPELDAGLRR